MALEESVIDSTRISDTLRFADVKEMRVKTEEELKLIKNRIAYLRKEEQKLTLKAKKSQEINLQVLEKQSKRAVSALNKQRILQEKQEKHEEISKKLKKARESQRERIQSAQRERRNKSLVDADKIKESSKEINENIQTQKLEENLRKLLSRQKVLNEKKHGMDKRRLQQLKEKSIVKVHTNNRIAEERQKKDEIDKDFERMVAEERELLMRINMTQIYSKSINDQNSITSKSTFE
jgi:hypothetical protein